MTIISCSNPNSKKDRSGTGVYPEVCCLNEIRCCTLSKLHFTLASWNPSSEQLILELSICLVSQRFLYPEVIYYIKTRRRLGRVEEHAFLLKNRRAVRKVSWKRKTHKKENVLRST